MNQKRTKSTPVKLEIVVGRGGPLNGFYNVADATKPRTAQERHVCSIFEAIVKFGIDIYFRFQGSVYQPGSYLRTQQTSVVRTLNKGIVTLSADERYIQIDRVPKAQVPADLVAIDLPERLIPWKKSHQ